MRKIAGIMSAAAVLAAVGGVPAAQARPVEGPCATGAHLFETANIEFDSPLPPGTAPDVCSKTG